MRYEFISTFDRADYVSSVRSNPASPYPSPEQINILINRAKVERGRVIRAMFAALGRRARGLFRPSQPVAQPR